MRFNGSREVHLGGVRHAGFIEESCRGVDAVFHLAGLIAIRYSSTEPEFRLESYAPERCHV